MVYYVDKKHINIDFICSIVADEEILRIHEAERKCKKDNIIRSIVGIICVLVLSILLFILHLWISTHWVTRILGFLISLLQIGFFAFLYTYGGFKEVDSKYYDRINLINLLPLVDEVLDISPISWDSDNFVLCYTLKDDGRKIVLEFILEGYRIEKSRAVKYLTIDSDSFTILKPY